MEDQHKFFANHRTFQPNVVGCENAEFSYPETFKNSFHVFGVNIFPFFCNDHVLLAARANKMVVTEEGENKIGRAHGCTPVTYASRMPASSCKKTEDVRYALWCYGSP